MAAYTMQSSWAGSSPLKDKKKKYISKAASKIKSSQHWATWMLVTESQNGQGWKGPLWVI